LTLPHEHRGGAVRRRHPAGELVAKDMIAVRVGPDLRMAVVGSPSTSSPERGRRTGHRNLTQHNCVNLHLPTHGGSLYAWEFERNGRELNVRVEGQLVFNSSGALLHAALQGLGLAYLTEGQVQPYLSSASLSACWRTGVVVFRIPPVLSQPTASFAGVSLLVDSLAIE